MTEFINDIALRWALRDIIAQRHQSMRVGDAEVHRLRELGWIEERDGELFVTETGLAALP